MIVQHVRGGANRLEGQVRSFGDVEQRATAISQPRVTKGDDPKYIYSITYEYENPLGVTQAGDSDCRRDMHVHSRSLPVIGQPVLRIIYLDDKHVFPL